MKSINEAILFRTSAASDVQCSGNVLTIAGLPTSTRKSEIFSFKEIKYRAEVVQVVRIGTVDTAWVPVGSTTYGVLIGDSRREVAGAQGGLTLYAYTTTASLATEGTTAALQREYINGKIITDINNNDSNYVAAASLLLGNGYTITDDAGYNPLLQNPANVQYAQGQNNRMGKSTVKIWQERDGSGYALTNITTSTAAVYSFGVGADLANGKPVMDNMYGNLISGTLIAPPVTSANLPAVSGQNYDAFVILSYTLASAHNQTGQFALIPKTQTTWVDNGTGSSVTNLAGFKAIERVFHKLMVGVYENDASTVAEWFDRPIVFQDPLGAAPTGTANTLGWQHGYTSLNRTNIGTQAIVAPVLDATGLLIDQDDTAGDGSHTSANQQTLGDQSYIVGKTAFMVGARFVMADITGSHFQVGFRKKAAYTADYNDYTDLASIGTRVSAALGAIATAGILNNAATINTVSADVFVNAVSAMLYVYVALDGTVTCKVNGTTYPVYSVGTTALIFDADDEMIPFYQHVNVGGGNPVLSIGEFWSVSDNKLVS